MDSASHAIDKLVLQLDSSGSESTYKEITTRSNKGSAQAKLTDAHSLDNYLDILEKKYKLGKFCSEDPVKEPSRDDIVRRVKKMNVTYRTAAKMLRQLQENSKLERKLVADNQEICCIEEKAQIPNANNILEENMAHNTSITYKDNEKWNQFFGIPLGSQKTLEENKAETNTTKTENQMRFFGMPLVVRDSKSSHYFYQNVPHLL